MKKLILLIPLVLLIFTTTLTKNSTKKLDIRIFEAKENLRVLYDKYELVMLEYNYLTSPKKLMEYQKKHFDNELVETEIQSLNSVEIKNEFIKINKLVNSHE